MSGLAWVVLLVVVLAVGWYLTYSAARLDRLHARAEGALTALDAQLVRRAEATLELANSGELDAASSLILAAAASESLERQTEHLVDGDLLDGVHFGGRESVESDLTAALTTALTPDVVAQVRAAGQIGAADLERIEAAAIRVQLARRFHNNAVTDVRRVREKGVVRLFRLAGHAPLPETVEFDDTVPGVRR